MDMSHHFMIINLSIFMIVYVDIISMSMYNIYLNYIIFLVSAGTPLAP